MSQDIIRQLKELKHHRHGMNPDPEWMKRSKEQLFSQIKNSVGEKPEASSFILSMHSLLKFFISPKLYRTIRVSFVFFVAIGVTVSGWIGGVSATAKCLPGEFCYNVKLAGERTQAVVASVVSDKNTEVELHLEFASRRLDEIRQVKNEHKGEAVKVLKKNVESVSNGLKEIKEQNPEKVALLAKDVTKKTSDIARTLHDVSEDPESKQGEAAKDLAEATKIVNDTGIEAIELALEGREPIESEGDEIKALVEEKIQLILDESKAMPPMSTTSVTSSPITSEIEVSPTSTSSTDETPVVETSPDPLVTSSEVTTLSEPAASVQMLSSEKIQEVALEAQELLKGNKVQEAIQKVKDLNSIVNESKQSVSEEPVSKETETPLEEAQTSTSSTESEPVAESATQTQE